MVSSPTKPSTQNKESHFKYTELVTSANFEASRKIFSSMSFKNFGKGYLLTPDNGRSHPDWGKTGTKPDYYYGGWWRNDLGGWFFRGSFLDFLKEQGATDISNKSKYSLEQKSDYKSDYASDMDQDFKKGKLGLASPGFWRGVCDVDATFQDKLVDYSSDNSSDEYCKSETDEEYNTENDTTEEEDFTDDDENVDEDDDENEDEDEDEDEDEGDFIDDDYEFVNANDVYYTRYANGLIVVGDLEKCGKILQEIGGVYNKSLKGYLFKSARVKGTLLDWKFNISALNNSNLVRYCIIFFKFFI